MIRVIDSKNSNITYSWFANVGEAIWYAMCIAKLRKQPILH